VRVPVVLGLDESTEHRALEEDPVAVLAAAYSDMAQ
jgi:hypothetical protein